MLFVIDAKAGVTTGDEAVAQALRKSGKTVILVANKCESHASDDGYNEAFALGFGEPVAVSAEHTLGFGALEEALGQYIAPVAYPEDGEDGHEAVDETDEEVAARPIRLAHRRAPNVGKSSLFNRLLGEERTLTGPEAGITRDAIAAAWHADGRDFVLHDTPPACAARRARRATRWRKCRWRARSTPSASPIA